MIKVSTTATTALERATNEQVRYLSSALMKNAVGRESMGYIQIIEDGTAVATDGFRVHSVILPPEICGPIMGTENVLLQTLSDGRAYALAKPRKKLPFTSRLAAWDVIIEGDHASRYVYPDWIPAVACNRQVAVQVNPDYLREALDNLPAGTVTIILSDEFVEVTSFGYKDNSQTYAMIMPIYPGELSTWGPTMPAVVSKAIPAECGLGRAKNLIKSTFE